MARQSPHILYRQAGRLVGLQCQWGEPVQSHKWEEAGIIDWVLVPGIEKMMWKWVRCLKVRACTEVLHWGNRPNTGHKERSGAFACQSKWKVSHARSVWTVICTLFTEIWEQQKKKKKTLGAVYQLACVQTLCCLSLGDKFPPLIMASCFSPTVSTSGSKHNKCEFLCLCMSLNGYLPVSVPA